MLKTALPKRTQVLPSLQRGFSMIELSVALLIALFLLAGLFTVVQNTRAVFINQNQLSQLQDSERFAMTLITDVVQQAGFYPDPVNNTATSILTTAGAIGSSPAFTAGQGLAGIHNAAAPGDTLSVRYLTVPGDGMINCQGQSNTGGANAMYTNVFKVSAANGLQCQVITNGVADATVTLLSNVTNLQILYGVQTNLGSTSNNVDSYLTATQVNAGNYWGNVVSVFVTVSFTNPLFGQPGCTAAACQTVTFSRVVTVMSKGGVNT